MKTKHARTAATARRKRTAVALARGARFWLNLRDSLDQSRTRGITLAEAKRRLAERLAAEGSLTVTKAARPPRSTRRPRGAARRA
jgi:hypothetical protein